MKKLILLIITFTFLLTGCSGDNDKYPSDYPVSKSYSIDDILYPSATNKKVINCNEAIIDYSNCNSGYIMAFLKPDVSEKIKIQVNKDDKKINYDLSDMQGVSYPLQLGNGKYTIKVLKNIEGSQYAIVTSNEIEVTLDNELLPYLYPNILVNYHLGDKICKLAIDTIKDDDNDLQRIKTIYEFVMDYLEYDDAKVTLAKQEYLIPNLDELLKEKKGICFDYASLMVAMLRINHIPARLICGGIDDNEYHAWLEVYLDGEGWVNPDIFVDKDTWTLMDPTFNDSKYKYDGEYVATSYY